MKRKYLIYNNQEGSELQVQTYQAEEKYAMAKDKGFFLYRNPTIDNPQPERVEVSFCALAEEIDNFDHTLGGKRE